MAEHLTFNVGEHGTYLVTRSSAAKVRMAAIGLLADHEHIDAMVLDFADVGAITNGWADEMVAKLIIQQDDRRILAADANQEVRDAIETAVGRRGLSIEFVAVEENHG